MESTGSSRDTAAALQDYEHPVSVEQFRKLGYEVIDMICDYMKSTADYKVVPDVKPGFLRPMLPNRPPEQPEPWRNIKQDFYSKIMKGVLHWQSPHYFAWFAGNTSIPGIIAEMLAAALNMVGFSWQSSPISTELEMVVMDWLAQLCGLPDKFLCSTASNNISNSNFGSNSSSNDQPDGSNSSGSSSRLMSGGGVIQTTSSESVLVAMLAAREKALKGQPPEAALNLVAYSSDQAHSCFKKAAMILGLQHSRVLQASADADYALQAEALAEAVQQDLDAGQLPFYMCATIGTTSSCAVDPVGELAAVCRRHNIWLHVDAAWAGAAAILPEQRHWFEGVADVHSYSFSMHKWLLTTWDCAVMWLEDTKHLKEALSITPVYLRGVGNVYDYKDWQIPLGRKFKSLKLWFILRMYGADKLRGMVRHHIALGEWFAEQVAADDRFQVAAPVRFGLVCFRLKGAGDAGNKKLLESINATGEVFIVGTELSKQYTLRFAVGQAHTQLQHVQRGWDLIQQQAAALLAGNSSAAKN